MRRSSGNYLGALTTAALLAVALAACGERQASGAGIEIADAWIRAVPSSGDGQVNTAAYMRIRNGTGAADRLIGVRSPVANRAELHRTTIGEDGLAMMGPAGSLELEPGQELVLEPGGLHVMLMGVEEGLEEGAVAQLTLLFDVAGEMTLEVEVRAH